METTTTLNATEFKSRCLRVMDEVENSKREVLITKHGRAVAKLVPIKNEDHEIFGCMRGSAEAQGDIFSTGEEWHATQ